MERYTERIRKLNPVAGLIGLYAHASFKKIGRVQQENKTREGLWGVLPKVLQVQSKAGPPST
jgi:hypothetical protein